MSSTRVLGAAVAISIGLTLADLARSQIEQYSVFDCASFGTNCTRAIPDFDPMVILNPPVEISLQVPESACETAAAVGATINLNHTWVGDLRVTLTQESTGRSVILVDRPGVDALGDFGCSGHGVDARIHDGEESDGDADSTCEITIPAIGGDKTSSPYGRRLMIEPDSPPSFDGCAFERFDGALIPSANSTLVEGACAPFTKPVESVCSFRGSYNDECGGQVTVRMTRDGDNMTLLVEEEAPARFLAMARAPTRASLSAFENGGSIEASGLVLLKDTGLSYFAGTPCAGTWTLSVYDRAAPNVGTVAGWSLLLLQESPATPTPLDTATAAAPTNTSSLPPTLTPTGATPATTPTAEQTVATPSATSSTPDTATPAVTATAEPTATTSSETPAIATPTTPATLASPTPSRTEIGPLTPTPAAETPTPDITATPAPCVGDCNGDGVVAINELILGVRIALAMSTLDSCPSFDADGDGNVEINELILAVNNALFGCP